MDSVTEELERRVPPGARMFAYRTMVRQTGHIRANLKMGLQKIDDDRGLSDEGRHTKKAAMVQKDHAPQLVKIAEAIARERRTASDARAKLRPAATDPGDVIGEMRRDQRRIFLRSLSPAERIKKLAESEAMRIAAMDVEADLSGLTAAEHAQLVSQHIQEKFGAELAELDQRDEAIACVEAALQVASSEIQRVAPPIVGSVRDRADAAIAARA